ncbi:MAG: zinc-ribbon domain-containing protein [Gemmatimonadetes bacterium]|nr:zinc-ribbon domain-containing protein [Gemmatimonadota bacterium]MDA1103184.1 zinc-ribbon domain-containing protein [Gemmatimonadota bacterium]
MPPQIGVGPLVFIGSRGVVKTHTRGLFRCPRCDASRAYAHRRIRRFLVFLFVPVVPLAGEEEFVQCGFCRRAYKPSVLESQESDAGVHARVDAEVSRRGEQDRTAPASVLLMWDAEGDNTGPLWRRRRT